MIHISDKQLFRSVCDLYFSKNILLKAFYDVTSSKAVEDKFFKAVKVLVSGGSHLHISKNLKKVGKDYSLIFEHAKSFHWG